MKKTLADLSEKLLITDRINNVAIGTSVSSYADDLCKTKIWVTEFGQENIPHADPYSRCVLCDGCNYNCPDYE